MRPLDAGQGTSFLSGTFRCRSSWLVPIWVYAPPGFRTCDDHDEETSMRLPLSFSAALVAAAGLASLLAVPQTAQAFPGKPLAADVGSPLTEAQYYYGGRRYCWYPDGWRGPGFYWCGYAWRHGFGWGGGHGWRGWGPPGPGPGFRPRPPGPPPGYYRPPGRPGGPGMGPGPRPGGPGMGPGPRPGRPGPGAGPGRPPGGGMSPGIPPAGAPAGSPYRPM